MVALPGFHRSRPPLPATLTVAVALAALAAGPTTPAAAAGNPVAILTAVRGKVEVLPAGNKAAQRATFGQALEKGDRVSVGAGGAATVFFHDGDVVELGERSALAVGARRPGSDKPELPGEVYAQVSSFVTAGSREEGLVAVTRMRGVETAAFLVAPRRTSILSRRPTCTWRAVAGASRYVVTLAAESGELWKQTVSDTACAFPDGAPDLAADADYLWEVEARSETALRQRESSVFHVVAEPIAAAVRTDLAGIEQSLGAATPACHYLAGSYLSGRGLYQDALERFAALCRLQPESPGPHEALGNVYRAVGLTDAAAAEFQQALALSKNP